MKKCPFCAEEIQDEAIKCKHCGEFLAGYKRPIPEDKKLPWYFGKNFIIIAVLCTGPFALPLIWIRPDTTRSLKIILTIVIVTLSWMLLELTLDSIQNLKELYNLMDELY